MALTALVKEELAQYEASKASVRKAEVSTILRFTGALHIVAGRIVIESEVDTEQTAQRMQQTIAEIYGHESELTSVTGGGLRRGGRYIVRVDSGGEALARQTGLLDLRGRPVRGLPPAVVNGSLQDAEAVMRGAFLAHGSLTEPGRSSAIEFTCPGPEAALALVGAARRLDVMAKAREVRGVDRVVVRDGETIAHLLERMPRSRCVRGVSSAPARRCEPRRTGWQILMMQTCAVPRRLLWLRAHGWNGPCIFWVMMFPNI